MSDVQLVVADPAVLRHLFEYYVYDFSELVPLDVDESGRFDVGRFERLLADPLCDAFVIRAFGKLAGFAVHEARSRITREEGVHDVAEFFVLRRYRRAGVGARAATTLFERFPGRWEVRQIAANVAATAFWRSVIAAHTSGAFTEETVDTERFRGVVHRFRTC